LIGSVTRTAERLKSIDNALILTHRRPDGDTAGSAGALCCTLRQMGKNAYVAANPEITRRYADLIEPYFPPSDWQPAYVIAVDCAAEDMIFPAAGETAKHVDMVIDHHGSNTGFGAENLVIGEYAACAEIVCEVIEELGEELSIEAARGIYIGASTDTGCFKFSNTTANTHRVAAKCLDTGLDGGEINRALFETKSRARYEIERMLFRDMKFYKDGKIAVALITREAKESTGADWDDLDAIAGIPRQIEGVEVGLTLTELKDGSTKLSARTTKEVDAAAICSQLGGGGHLRAAGATMNCPSAEAICRALDATERVYRGETDGIHL
jgi:phosphoesterase RecJ-like protein